MRPPAVSAALPAAANSFALRKKEVPCVPAGHRGQRPRLVWRRLCVAARRRSTGRGTSQQQPPIDPDRRWRATGGPSTVGKEKEPFDAELMVLFGLPALVLVIAFAFNDPTALAVAVPLGLLIPGVRDVILHIASDLLRGARSAHRFVSLDSYEGDEQEQHSARQWRWEQQAAAAQRRPPPPPPPPPPQAAVEYEMRAGEYHVNSAPEEPVSPFANGWPTTPHSGHGIDSSSWQTTVRSPFADGWPAEQPDSSSGGGWFAGTSSGMDASWQQQTQHTTLPRSPFADGWPAEQPAASHHIHPPDGSSWHQLPSIRRLRRTRSTGPPAAATVPAQPAAAPASAAVRPRRSRQLVRPAGKGRVGVYLQGDRDTTPLLLRPLFALLPFLRYWGGFL